jgi:YebC/PmpR family DNA-binding regulatory protein
LVPDLLFTPSSIFLITIPSSINQPGFLYKKKIMFSRRLIALTVRTPCACRATAAAAPFSTTAAVQSGHNKWSTIKHDKAKNDAQRNKVNLKCASQIAVAARVGGSIDPAINFRLATAIEQANRQNVPKKIIESAIKRGGGISASGGAVTATEMPVYEGIGPGGVAFVVETLTDNKNRTVGQVKAAFTKAGGVLSPTAYLFARRGWIEVHAKPEETSVDDAFETLVDLGAEDLEQVERDPNEEAVPPAEAEGLVYAVYTSDKDTGKVAKALADAGYRVKDMGIEYVPNEDTAVPALADAAQRVAFEKLCAALDDIDDVVDFYTNLI